MLSPSGSFTCGLEWGAAAVVQTACATESYVGKPRYDLLWYTNEDGLRELGCARLVLRMLGSVVDDFVVVRRLRPVLSLSGCSLTRSGCTRMGWCFASATDDRPLLHRVLLSRVLRVEHVVPDFQDSGDRRGLCAVLSNNPDTADGSHAQRLFTKCFYTWTSQVQNFSN